MKLHFWGTDHATIKENYNTCFVTENEKDYFLVDGGGGKRILKNLEEAKIDVHKINHALSLRTNIPPHFGNDLGAKGCVLWLCKKRKNNKLSLVWQ